ncbi:hypothetical protein [Lysobacter sp. N42]|uniref:hypothetical protein n=1 Tax=Lysobacter sp. N42 TaxID=2545719 RepID=UPI0010470975|nr:hypothetical protein [Lysobacter sp. N42]TCZ88685.1 hypothetical protein EYQ95_13720 [Lysobacter sp. N42]
MPRARDVLAASRSGTPVVVLRMDPRSVFLAASRGPEACRAAPLLRSADDVFAAPRPPGVPVRAFVPAAALPRATDLVFFAAAFPATGSAVDFPAAPPAVDRFAVFVEVRATDADAAPRAVAPDASAPRDFDAAARRAPVDVAVVPVARAGRLPDAARNGEAAPAPPVRAAVFLASAPFAAVVRCEVPDAAPARRVGARPARAAEASATGWRAPPVAPTFLAAFFVLRPGAVPRARVGPAFLVAIRPLRMCSGVAVPRSTARMQDG